MRVLCLAAHPDDEVLGAGGTLLAHRAAGDETALLVATAAYEPNWSADSIRRKRDECLAAAKLLGVSAVRFLDLPTMHLNTLPAIELNQRVAEAVAELAPDVVYAPPLDDVNRDHTLLFEAALVATRPTGAPGPRALYSFEIPTTTRFAPCSRWQANTYVDVAAFIDAKLEAMACYQTELRDPPHPRSLESIRVFARERGAAVGLRYAEAHMLIRQVSRW
ncbi:1D-myo-inositol 2-acetamido-2-deoxy-alpha-D-glucopyranoside deacetylase [Phycisphaerae bacterium RAS1]|nr:1D-myo-inositol 2-acetamido-2-deoxy-alpha-D-glucopyranoside deacetylase [Phycisphaerae bacterium RAS1]